MNLQPNSTKTFYLRVQTSGTLQLPILIHTENHFFKAAISENTNLGLYYGIFIVMIIFNGLLALQLRDRAYAFYTGYLVLYLLFQLCLNGNAFRFLFPDAPAVASSLLVGSGWAAFGLAFLFAREFLNLNEKHPRWHTFLKTSALILLGAAPLSLVIPYSIGAKIGAIALIAAAPVLIIAGVISWNTWHYFGIMMRQDYTEWVFASDLVDGLNAANSFDDPGRIYFYAGRWNYQYETVRFLYPDTPGIDRSMEWGEFSLERIDSGPVTYLMLPPYAKEIETLKDTLPDGVAIEEFSDDGSRTFSVYHLP